MLRYPCVLTISHDVFEAPLTWEAPFFLPFGIKGVSLQHLNCLTNKM